ncbi:hypothetical protein MBLNU13_g00075t1 [Cladosporium sp. NU13]
MFISNTSFMFIAQELSPKTPTFPRTDQQPGATSTPLKQARKQAHVKSPPRKIRLIHTPQTTFHSFSKMANGWSLLISIIFIVVFSAVAWFASPKGENQTVWRSTLILSAWSCWLMWGMYYAPATTSTISYKERAVC